MRTLKMFLILSITMIMSYNSLAQVAQLSEEDKNNLTNLLIEEKLSRDIYVAYNDMWDLNVFQYTTNSEKQNIQLITFLADRYAIQLPECLFFDEPGVFEKASISRLYNTMVREGETSMFSAMNLSAKMEEMDIRKFRKLMNETSNPEILQILEKLETNAQKHLTALIVALEHYGDTYEPQILSLDEFNAIIKVNTNNRITL